MAYYSIQLQPLAPFFFGTELQAELGNRQNYFQSSRLFPQQTTLLGMLRHQLILQQGLIPIDTTNKGEVDQLIGYKSFQVVINDSSEKPFGAIKRLSPVFLGKGSGDYFVVDKTEVSKKAKQTELLVEYLADQELGFYLRKEKKSETAKDKKGLIRLKYPDGAYYLSKHPFVSLLKKYGEGEGSGTPLKLDDIIHTPEKVGIDKQETSDKDSAGYFKMRYQQLATTKAISTIGNDTPYDNKFSHYEFTDAWSFCLYLELEDSTDFNLDTSTRLVTMGKEQSLFRLSIQALDETEPSVFTPNETLDLSGKQIYRITLVSDTFVPNEASLYQLCILINANTIRFRNIMTETDPDTNYYARPKKSQAFNLLKRGTVLYVKKENIKEVEKVLNERADFKQIGYNYFIIEKQNHS